MIEQLFTKRLRIIDRVCEERQICRHDQDHHDRVLQNALVLNACLPTPASEDDIHTLILLHDIGYSLSGLTWRGKSAINHAEHGNRILTRAASIFLHGEQRVYGTKLIAALPTTATNALSSIQAHTHSWNGGANTILPYTIKLADCFDYFHHDRVDHLAPMEHDKDEGMYYVLASNVILYTLLHDQERQAITWSFEIKKNIDADLWLDIAHKNFPNIFALAEIYCTKAGLPFAVTTHTSMYV